MSAPLDLTHARWVKSSYSNGNEGQCVECALGNAMDAGVVPVRDSKNPSGATLVFPLGVWAAFVSSFRIGKLPTRGLEG